MIDLWLDSGTAVIVLVPFTLLYLVGAGIVWLTHLSPARPFFASCIGIVGPFFASVAVLFSLFAAFLANDVRHQSDEAAQAVAREADGLRSIMRLTEALGAPAAPLHAAALAYANAVLSQEWPDMRRGAILTENLLPLRNLILAVLTPELAASTPAAAHQALVDGLVEVRQARVERVTLTAGHSAPVNWLGVVILGVLTQVAVAVVQLDKLRPQALALFVFTTAFAATIVLIGLYARPFAANGVSDAPLRAAVATGLP